MESQEFVKILRWLACNFKPDFLYECFDQYLASHIADKYYSALYNNTQLGAVIETFLNLDSTCQEIMINRIKSKNA